MRNGKIFKNYDMINIATKKGRNAFLGAIQHNYAQAQRAGELLRRAGITEFTSSQNFPDDVLAIVDKFHVDIAELDTGYEAGFDTIDLTSVKTSSFTVRSSQSGLTFKKVLDGDKARIYSVSGGEVTVSLNLYGGALQWLKTWFDDGEWWTIEDNALEFRRKWFEEKAVLFYDMIQSLAQTYNTVYSSSGTTTLDKDRNTIGDAAYALINRHRDTGLGVTAGTPLLMYCDLSMKNRVEQALNPSRTLSVSGVGINYNITPVYTSYLDWTYVNDDGSTKWTGDAGAAKPLGYMCIPGRKNKIGNRMNLTLLAETDILAFAETVAGWGRYGAFMNETQWQRTSSIA
ncbi:hypothetical protein KAR91_20745 [Candidatus Pacearchaeota archaeon]|nr:hypothetical protein [Candidatus Pacearchaeota archaeon]